MLRLNIIRRLVINQLSHHRLLSNEVKISERVRTFKKPERYQEPIKINEQRESLLKAADDPDTFGSLSVDVDQAEDDIIDEGDIREENFLKNPPTKSQKLSTKQYADLIKGHLKNNQIKEAIDVLEVRMIQEDRVKPENYIFNLLIGGCARVGFTKKSFELYNKMKQRGLRITGGTYTSLFNACANTPWLNDGIIKANRLREIMIEKSYEPNASNYNAMIKAFGRCNDLKTAFLLVDEMIEKDIPVKIDTFNFVLQACVSDKEFGFRHALLVWHKIFQKRLKPDIYSFNLMLKCVRDTNLGDVETANQVIQQILLNDPSNNKQLLIEREANSNNLKSDVQLVSRPPSRTFDPTPNLLSPQPHLGELVALNEVSNPEDRLLLLGGFSGFMEVMKSFEVEPDIKTYTELLEVIPPTIAAEKRLLSSLRKASIKCDIDFFNILIKKRSMRFDYQGAKEVIPMIKTAKLQPDIVTYGVLSLGCQTLDEARELQQEMSDKGIKMNMQILGAMLRQGAIRKDFKYVSDIMKFVQQQNMKPNEKFLTHLHNFQKTCESDLKDKNIKCTQIFKNSFISFKKKVDLWREENGIKDLSLEDSHKKVKDAPWEQFQTIQAPGFEDVKNQKLRHEQKIKRYIKRIKEVDLKVTDGDEEDPRKLYLKP